MKKFLSICLLIAVIAAFPAYAFNSENPNVQEKIQKLNPDVYAEIKNTFNQIQMDPRLSVDVANLKSEFKKGNLTLSEIVQKPNVQSNITDILQNQSVRMQIHDFTQNENIRDSIFSLMQDNDIKAASDILMQNQEISNYVYMIIYGE